MRQNERARRYVRFLANMHTARIGLVKPRAERYARRWRYIHVINLYVPKVLDG